MNPEEIEKYSLDKSKVPSSYCDEIHKYTRENVPMFQMLIGPMLGSFFGFLVENLKAKRVLEIGCFTGYSALAMAERMPDNSELISLDINKETSQLAEAFWKKSPHGKKIKVIVGPALQSLENLKGPFDFVLIDADKENYPLYFEKALELLSPRGIIALDNALRNGRVLEANPDAGTKAIRDLSLSLKSRSDLSTCLLPIRDGVLLVQRSA